MAASDLLASAVVLAHQGGWDEILMVLTPIALFAALLWLANSRASRIQHERSEGSTPSTDPSAPDGPAADDAPSGPTPPPDPG